MIDRFETAAVGALLLALVLAPCLRAETGEAAWLRYARLDAVAQAKYAGLPQTGTLLRRSPVLDSAESELVRGLHGILGVEVRTVPRVGSGPSIVLGTAADLNGVLADFSVPTGLRKDRDGFWLNTRGAGGNTSLFIVGASDRGVLYGVFAFLNMIARGEDVSHLDEVQNPNVPLRWVDQWDNLDGSIERGYAGRSIFFENGAVKADLTRAGEYARLLASVGINGCAVNNVNADERILTDAFLEQLTRIADMFRPWGVRLALAVDVSSPKTIGGLETFDPLDPRVSEWWRKKADEVYRRIPDFGGFVVKADSEGRSGPSVYHRTQADQANVIARGLKPHGGMLFYRTFVYDHHLDWRNLKNDRARAAYDIFHPLDGKFEDNVVLQIKHGPIDFQVREPVSPLLGGLRQTNEAVELQITQEYTGQQRHLCFLVPMWKEVLDFDLHAEGTSPVKNLVAGKVFHRPMGGLVGVANVGLDPNWLGHPLAAANLYGFGRLAWGPDLSGETIAEEWSRLTFGNDSRVVKTITAMQLASWNIYEGYTGPLGAGTLTDILGNHFDPGVESSERNGWGQWHRADHDGIGMDRSMATGTGYVGQYSPQVQKLYESTAATPDELLLFFHHVPYTYRLHSGKTVIQHIYDSHYDGADRAAGLARQWESLKGKVDDERYAATLARLNFQARHAIEWRDAVVGWFLRTSGIPDAQGRTKN